MRYVLLIYGADAQGAPDESVMGEWWKYDQEVRDAGVYVAADALQPTATATSLRIKDGERIVTDGPFAETREVLGGYYVIDVPDLDTALEWAAKCPGARFGTMEVRPTVDMTALAP